MSDPDLIREITRRCLEALAKLKAQKDVSDRYREWAENQGARLKVWSATLGVNARGRMSIAYRLRLNAPMAMMILQLLEGIESCLHLLLSEVCKVSRTIGIGTPTVGGSRNLRRLLFSKNRSRPPSTEETSDRIEQILRDAKAEVGLLLDIAADLRKLGTQKEEQKALDFNPTDDEGNSLVDDFKQYVQTQCRLHLLRTRIANEVKDDQFEDGPRLAHATDSVIRDVGGGNSEADLSKEFIIDRLEATILQRWRLLCYRSHHGRSLAYESISVETTQEPQDNEAALLSGGPAKAPIGPTRLSRAAPKAPRTIMSSVATEVTADREVSRQPQEEKAPRTVLTKSSGVALKDVDFPREPRADGQEVLCTLCWIPTPANDLQGRLWKSHVLRDLSPYICVFTNCSTPEARYPTTKLLKQHMEMMHVDMDWTCPRCPTTGDEAEGFADPAVFSDHIRTVHKEPVTESDMRFILEHAVRRKPHVLQACIFCNGHGRDQKISVAENWAALFRHMTRDHMQSLAMLSLPWDKALDRSSDTKQSSIASSRERLEEELEELREVEPLVFAEEDELPIGAGIALDLETIKERFPMQRVDPQLWVDELTDSRLESPNSNIANDNPAQINGNTHQNVAENASHYPQVSLTRRREDYTVGWISGLPPSPRGPPILLFDEQHDDTSLPQRYDYGRMNGHNIVLGYIQNAWNSHESGAHLAMDMERLFPSIRFFLLVGLGGGVWSEKHDVRLGDVVVQLPDAVLDSGGLLQLSLGQVGVVGSLGPPPDALLSAAAAVRSKSTIPGGSKFMDYLASYKHRGVNYATKPKEDRLFIPAYGHQANGGASCKNCSADFEIARKARYSDLPVVHFGTIGSLDIILRDSKIRDELSGAYGILCFETEATGLPSNIPALAVRGIYDYCDSHSNRDWQRYAGATAAAWAKELLRNVPPRELSNTNLFVEEEEDCNESLLRAAENGNDAAVRSLLATDNVDVDSKDLDGRTPLSLAAEYGHESVVNLLLATGKVDIDSKDFCGRTALSLAAEYGHEAVVNLLLATGKIHVDSKDRTDSTPLSFAAEAGHEAVVKLLLATGKTHVDSKDLNGKTPLSLAAEEGHEAVAKLLLATGDVDVNSKDWRGRSPLSLAAAEGHEAVVNLLLATSDVDVNSKDNTDWTPLLFAAKRGHESVVKLLLATGDVDVNSKNAEGRTPLSLAAEQGHKAVVNILLSANDVDVNSRDIIDRTPLFAAIYGQETTIRLLLATGEVNLERKDHLGESALEHATSGAYETVVEMLLDHGAEVDVEGPFGKMLEIASRTTGHSKMIQMLLNRRAALIAARGEESDCSRQAAASEGHDESGRRPLNRGDDITLHGGRYPRVRPQRPPLQRRNAFG